MADPVPAIVIKCLNCGNDNPGSNLFCGRCGARMDAPQAALAEAIRAVIKQELRDQKVVEVEITQAIASRLTDWAKLFGFFAAIPLGLLLATLAIWGVSKFADVNDKLTMAQDRAKALQDTSSELGKRYTKLEDQLSQFEALNEKVQDLQTDVSQISKQIGFVPSSALTPDLKQKLEAELAHFIQYMQGVGYMPESGRVSVSVVDNIPSPPSPNAVAAFSPHDRTLVVTKTYALGEGNVLEEYMNVILKDKGRPGPANDYETVKVGLFVYFPSSFLGAKKFNTGADALGTVLWSIRDQIGSKALDSAVFRSWEETQDEYASQHYESLFAQKLIDLLGTNGAKAKAVLASHGIQTLSN
jgi:hypothetical protein